MTAPVVRPRGFPAFGPLPGACRCWHVRAGHPDLCSAQGCGCTRYAPSVYGLFTLALAAIRGVR